MRLTVLGCWAPYPRPGGACPGYLVQSKSTNLLLDCGNGVLSKLGQCLDFRVLDGLVITHYHPDHYMDLFCLRHAIWGSLKDGSRRGSLPVWLPGEPVEKYRELARYRDVFDIITIEGLPAGLGPGDKTTEVRDLQVTFHLTTHPLSCYGVAITPAGQSGPKLVYAADTGYDRRLVPFIERADLLICEASLQEKDAEVAKAGHLTASRAGQLAREARVKKLLLTHFWPEYDLETTRREAEAAFGGEVILAREHLVYDLGSGS